MEKTHYKLIVLIIDSDDLPVYAHYRNTIKKYMNTSCNMLSFFIRFDANLENDVKLENNTLFFKGNDSMIPGILQKTIKAFNYCLDNYSFDFILRTNLSSFYNYRLLEKFVYSLKKNDMVFGFELWSYNIRFPSGSCFIMSRDTIKLCANYDYKFMYNYPDDVCIGEVITKYNMQISKMERYDYTSQSIQYEPEMNNKYYNFRVKSDDRMNYDSKIFELLYNDIYGDNKLQ
jgi:hypothetical protein